MKHEWLTLAIVSHCCNKMPEEEGQEGGRASSGSHFKGYGLPLQGNHDGEHVRLWSWCDSDR